MFSCTYEIPNKKNINYTKESGKKKSKIDNLHVYK